MSSSATVAPPSSAPIGNLATLRSEQLCVGHILRIRRGEEFPVDCVLLRSSHLDGSAYINTANLDGEAAPKAKLCPSETMDLTPSDLLHLRGFAQIDPPTASLYSFSGRMQLDFTLAPSVISATRSGGAVPPSQSSPHGGAMSTSAALVSAASSSSDPLAAFADVTIPLSDKQLLLRGAKLVNTDYVFALTIATGPDTKLILNRSVKQTKFPSFEKQMNRMIVVSVVLNAMVCILLACYFYWNTTTVKWSANFLPQVTSLRVKSGSDWGLAFVTLYILFSWMIPQSLYVTVELVKLGQSIFINIDQELTVWEEQHPELEEPAHSPPTHEHPVLAESSEHPQFPPAASASSASSSASSAAVSTPAAGPATAVSISPNSHAPTRQQLFASVKAASLNEELALVQCICTDKTGTLTRNIMEMSSFACGGLSFLDSITEGQLSMYDLVQMAFHEIYRSFLLSFFFSGFLFLLPWEGGTTSEIISILSLTRTFFLLHPHSCRWSPITLHDCDGPHDSTH